MSCHGMIQRVLGLAVLLTLCSSSSWAQNFEPNTDRQGMDIRDFDLPSNSKLCYNACQEDQRCRSFTFKKAPDNHSPAHCWLKNGIPGARYDQCCVSGIVRPNVAAPRPANYEPNTNRMGLDFRNFDIPSNSQLCYNACRDDQQCRAFTFVKSPGNGAPAHCWLKSGIPEAKYDQCCVSGVVRP
jgi:predicted phosphoadenosine phosphosulfate sulfurtransferase